MFILCVCLFVDTIVFYCQNEVCTKSQTNNCKQVSNINTIACCLLSAKNYFSGKNCNSRIFKNFEKNDQLLHPETKMTCAY